MGYGDIVKTVVSINEETIPIKIDDSNLPQANPKCTRREKVVYTGLLVKEFRSGNYLIAKKNIMSGIAPIGAIVYYHYRTGSWKNAYLLVDMWFKVAPVGEKKIKINDDGDTIVVKNLIPLSDLSDDQIAEAKADIVNNGWKPSDYDPVDKLYYYWVKQKERKPIKVFTFNIFSIDDIDKAIQQLQQFKKELAKARVKTVVKSL